MLNNTGIKKETYGSGNQILFAVEHQVSMGIVVDQTVGVTVGNKKIAKAGTPITGSLDARETAFTAAKAGSASEIKRKTQRKIQKNRLIKNHQLSEKNHHPKRQEY